MHFLKHPAWLWLRKYEKDKLPPIDENTQVIFSAGHKFESYAEKLFPKAIKLGFKDYEQYKTLPTRTNTALEKGAQTILQGRFEADGITCIIDILARVENNTFDLIEIKSSNRVKPEHEYDLAFQSTVLEKCGLNIRNTAILLVNSDYVRDGDIEPEKIITKTDVTGAIKQLKDTTLEQINKAFAVLAQGAIPDISARYVNQVGVPKTSWFKEWLEIYKHLKPELDPYNVYFLSYPNAEQIAQLEDNGIELIKDVPDKAALRAKQLAQIKTTRENKRIIKKGEIKEFIDTFTYPLYFLDYETLSSVIPAFDGYQPWKDYPFQCSLHILESPHAEPKHEEYLHRDKSDPIPELLKKLKADIGSTGTILTWNMSYEKSCNDRMAKLYPESKEFLDDLDQRINDLMMPFSEMWFVDKDFHGSASLKNVLPVLVPELSHEELEITDGLKARRMWTQTVLEGKNQDQKEKILTDLRKYCTLDTYAMVRILEELRKLCGKES